MGVGSANGPSDDCLHLVYSVAVYSYKHGVGVFSRQGVRDVSQFLG